MQSVISTHWDLLVTLQKCVLWPTSEYSSVNMKRAQGKMQQWIILFSESEQRKQATAVNAP